MTVEPIARIAMDRMRFLRFRMMFDGADHRLTGVGCNGMRCFATENDRKGKMNSQAYFVAQSEPMEIVQVKEGKTRKGSKGGKIGRPRIPVSEADQKKALEACKLGIPLERVAILCGFPSGNAGRWHDFLKRNPDFANELELARLEGELELSSVVRQCGNGWQGSAWLLERTRGYVARASLEHTGKGGKELSISGSLLGAFGGQSK
jgi:hypothetical protein